MSESGEHCWHLALFAIHTHTYPKSIFKMGVSYGANSDEKTMLNFNRIHCFICFNELFTG